MTCLPSSQIRQASKLQTDPIPTSPNQPEPDQTSPNQTKPAQHITTIMRLSASLSALMAVATAMLSVAPTAQAAFDHAYFCYIIPRFLVGTNGPRPTNDQMVWAFAQVLQTHKTLYRYVDNMQFVLDGVRLEYWSDVYKPGSRGRRLQGNGTADGDGDDSDDKGERKHKPYNATDFDIASVDVNMLHDFKRFDNGGLDMDTILQLEAEGGENFGQRRNLRGDVQDRLDADLDANADTNRDLAEYYFGDGYDFSGRFSGRVGCYDCHEWQSRTETITHGGNTEAYLHWRWEAGWCEALTQKARRNSAYSVFAGSRDCDIYMVGCRSGRRLEAEGEADDVDDADTAGAGASVPASMVDSYRAMLAEDSEKAAIAMELEAQHEAMMAAGPGNSV